METYDCCICMERNDYSTVNICMRGHKCHIKCICDFVKSTKESTRQHMPDNVEGYDLNTGADFNVKLVCPLCSGDILPEVLDICKDLDKGPMSPPRADNNEFINILTLLMEEGNEYEDAYNEARRITADAYVPRPNASAAASPPRARTEAYVPPQFRPSASAAASPPRARTEAFPPSPPGLNSWTCDFCGMQNDENMPYCEMCHKERQFGGRETHYKKRKTGKKRN